jgi:hypothetical protein
MLAPPEASSEPCSLCGRSLLGRKMASKEVGYHRANLCAALGERGDVLAYILATTSTLPLSVELSCSCDRYLWLVACQDYVGRGSVACWAALGITDD